MLPSLLSLPYSWDFLLPLPVPDKVGRFRVRFRFQLILSKRIRFRILRFLLLPSNCMLTAQHNTEKLMYRKSVKFTKLLRPIP